jgi:hypothetical protein
MCEDFSQNFGDRRTGCCITTMHRLTLLFSPGEFFTKNNLTVVRSPLYSPLEDTTESWVGTKAGFDDMEMHIS